jgi:2-polyprenyl-3-methyl-5-hydroxy-6-metoxy-1,4-benzoquinol methylase
MSPRDLLRMPRRILGHLFFDKSYENYYSAEEWDDKFKGGFGLDNPMEDSRYGALMMIMKRYEKKGPVLDFGCGDGLLQERFRAVSRVRLVGIDYAPAAIDRAKTRGLPDCEFICTDYRKFQPFEKYSLLVFNEAIYYIDDYIDVLERMSDHLMPNGHIVISMFHTRVTARIWKQLMARLQMVQGVLTCDERSGLRWTIRVFERPGSLSEI